MKQNAKSIQFSINEKIHSSIKSKLKCRRQKWSWSCPLWSLFSLLLFIFFPLFLLVLIISSLLILLILLGGIAAFIIILSCYEFSSAFSVFFIMLICLTRFSCSLIFCPFLRPLKFTLWICFLFLIRKWFWFWDLI